MPRHCSWPARRSSEGGDSQALEAASSACDRCPHSIIAARRAANPLDAGPPRASAPLRNSAPLLPPGPMLTR